MLLTELPEDVLRLILSQQDTRSRRQIYMTCRLFRDLVTSEVPDRVLYRVSDQSDIAYLLRNRRNRLFRRVVEPALQLRIMAQDYPDWTDDYRQWPVYSICLSVVNTTILSASLQVVELHKMDITDASLLHPLKGIRKIMLMNCRIQTQICSLFEKGSKIKSFTYTENIAVDNINPIIPALEEIQIDATAYVLEEEPVGARQSIYLNNVHVDVPEVTKTYQEKVSLHSYSMCHLNLSGYQCRELLLYASHKIISIKDNIHLDSLSLVHCHVAFFHFERPLKHLFLSWCNLDVAIHALDYMPTLESLELHYTEMDLSQTPFRIHGHPGLRRVVYDSPTRSCSIKDNPNLTELLIHARSIVTSVRNNCMLPCISIFPMNAPTHHVIHHDCEIKHVLISHWRDRFGLNHL